MNTLIKEVLNRLSEKVPQLKYIDEDWGQLDYYSQDMPVKWPCALIDVKGASYSNESRLVQLGMVTLRVLIADIRKGSTLPTATSNLKEQAYSIFDLLEQVYKSLQGWSAAPHIGLLIRTTLNRMKRDDGVRQFEMVFTCSIVDRSATPVLQKLKVENVEVETGLVTSSD